METKLRNLIVIFVLPVFFSVSAYAYQLVKVGEVESRQWNDVWDKFYNQPLYVYAGENPDGSDRTIRIKIKNSFGDDYYKDFYFKKCSEKKIKKGKCDKDGFVAKNKDYGKLLYIIQKGIEWGNLAVEKNVQELSKYLTDDKGKDILSPFIGGWVRYYVNGENQQDLILPVKFPLLGDADRYYSLSAQKKLLEILAKEIYDAFDESKLISEEADDLFK